MWNSIYVGVLSVAVAFCDLLCVLPKHKFRPIIIILLPKINGHIRRFLWFPSSENQKVSWKLSFVIYLIWWKLWMNNHKKKTLCNLTARCCRYSPRRWFLTFNFFPIISKGSRHQRYYCHIPQTWRMFASLLSWAVLEHRIRASNIRLFCNSATCWIYEWEFFEWAKDSRMFGYSNILKLWVLEYLYTNVRPYVDLY